MPNPILISPRFELFLALAAVLRAEADGPLWLAQARRKLDQAARRRMGDLALTPAVWPALAAVPETAALEGDADAVIAALADLPAAEFARRLKAALRQSPADPALDRVRRRLDEDAAGLQQSAVEALRRFDRLVFAALWRRAASDLEAAGHQVRLEPGEAIVFPSLFAEQGFRFGAMRLRTVPVDRLATAMPQSPSAIPTDDPEPVFRALGDATRYAIARLVAREALTGAELARRLGVSGPTLTHHLKLLRAARLVRETRRGNRILIRLERSAIEALSAAALESLFGARPIEIRRSRRS